MEPGPESVEKVAERLELLRIAVGYESRAAFARSIDRKISPQQWSSYLHGTLIPVPLATVICRRYKVDLNWLYHGDRSGLTLGLIQKLEAAETLRNGRQQA